MSVFEMPLDELKKYRGINPCPKDFNEYWSQALEEMKSIDPNIEMLKSDFKALGAECFDLYFTGVGNARIHAQYLRPEGGNYPHPAVLMFHGYSIDSGDWVEKLPYVSLGYSVAALDCRGQGGLSEDSGGVKGNTLKASMLR